MSYSDEEIFLVLLPSRGICYGDDNLLRHGFVRLKHIVVDDEQLVVRLTADGYDDKDIVDKLIASKFIDDIKVEDLCVMDRIAIMIYLLRSHLGESMTLYVSKEDSDVNESFELSFDDLSCEDPILRPFDNGLFGFNINDSMVLYKYPTHNDVYEFTKTMKGEENSKKYNAIFVDFLCKLIVSVDGDEDKKVIRRFIRSLKKHKLYFYISTILGGMGRMSDVVNVKRNSGDVVKGKFFMADDVFIKAFIR